MNLDKPLSIYDCDKNNKNRFSLGELSKASSKTIIVFGINPSKATNIYLDSTVTNVNSFTRLLGYENFLMLNLYPQRSTDPAGMHKRKNQKIYDKNLEIIKKYLTPNSHIWAAWGNLISSRSYLWETLIDIFNECYSKKQKWIYYDKFTKQYHPPHPSRKRLVNNFNSFDLKSYLKAHGKISSCPT